MILKKKKSINDLKDLYKENRLIRFTEFLIGVLMLALAYNIFMRATNAMYGIGGVGIVINKLFGVPNYIFILGANVLLLMLIFFCIFAVNLKT